MEMNPYFFKMVENPIFYLLQDDSIYIVLFVENG